MLSIVVLRTRALRARFALHVLQGVTTPSSFVCVEVLRPSQPSGVMSSAVSLPNHTFTGQALSSKRLISIVHILSPEFDNCSSLQRTGENDRRKYFMINLHERMLPTSAVVEPATSWSQVRRRIQLSHRGRLHP